MNNPSPLPEATFYQRRHPASGAGIWKLTTGNSRSGS